jgi:hypothetical protein
MKKLFCFAALLSLALAGCALVTNNPDSARRACVEHAREQGHKVQEVEGVKKEQDMIWIVVLDVGRQRIRCEYDALRGRAQLL